MCRIADRSQPVAVLEVHGTSDATVLYDGGTFGPAAYPGAVVPSPDGLRSMGVISLPTRCLLHSISCRTSQAPKRHCLGIRAAANPWDTPSCGRFKAEPISPR